MTIPLGASFAQSGSPLTARIAYVDFDGSRALAASEHLPLDEPLPDDFEERWCERVVQGVERLAGWVGGRVNAE